MNRETPALRLTGVRKVYEPRVILRGVDLDVLPGVTLLTGSNGAGKSTLLRLMAGLERPTSGQVLRENTAPAAYVGHTPCLYAGLSALENLRFWDRVCGGDAERSRLMEALERVNLARHAEDRAGTFSRGMAQRLNLARVLLTSTDLWLLDEPDTGLDAASAALLLHEIEAARNRGVAVVWITHHADAHRGLAERVLVLHTGRVYAEGVETAEETAC